MTKIVHAPTRTLRAAAYPKPGDQLDELWRAFAALAAGQPAPQSALDMLAQINATKARYPKKATK